MYKLVNIFIGGGLIEVTSTDDCVLKKMISYLTKTLLLSVNNLDIQQYKNKIFNIRIIGIENTSLNNVFFIFWNLVDFIGNECWEPYAQTGSTIAFKKLFND